VSNKYKTAKLLYKPNYQAKNKVADLFKTIHHSAKNRHNDLSLHSTLV